MRGYLRQQPLVSNRDWRITQTNPTQTFDYYTFLGPSDGSSLYVPAIASIDGRWTAGNPDGALFLVQCRIDSGVTTPVSPVAAWFGLKIDKDTGGGAGIDAGAVIGLINNTATPTAPSGRSFWSIFRGAKAGINNIGFHTVSEVEGTQHPGAAFQCDSSTANNYFTYGLVINAATDVGVAVGKSGQTPPTYAFVGTRSNGVTATSISNDGDYVINNMQTAGAVGIGTAASYRLHVTQSTDADTARIYNTHATFSNAVLNVRANRAGSSAYYFLGMVSDSAGTPDNEFLFRGDGQATADGSFTGGGADYGEYFEWEDGNPNDEDRRGYSVVLVGSKIRKALKADDPKAIIGVVSGNPTVVGDAAWNKWTGKHLRDEFGSYIMEKYSIIEWDETVIEEMAVPKSFLGAPPTTSKTETRSYPVDQIPEGIKPPDDALIRSSDDNGKPFVRRKLNPKYDPDKPYVNREDRPEWDIVGLMGKLRVRKGQQVGDRWIKMRDVSDRVEEWLVR